VSFLALEAIGAAITLSYGFTNAMWAIGVVTAVIFLTGLPIAVHAARHGLDMDLLARGAGFGYLGSTITSLIYASFTFIFFALEAAIMAQAFELWFGMPRAAGYVLSAVIVIPLVTHGVTLISRLQLWTQPLCSRCSSCRSSRWRSRTRAPSASSPRSTAAANTATSSRGSPSVPPPPSPLR
jgi:hypothetical protein